MNTETTKLTPRRLQPGDRVKLLSPASPPDREKVATGIRLLESWGLTVEVGAHAFDRHGHFLAGKDEDRLADWNEALQDPGVRAIFTTRGGKGAYRIAHALDFAAARSRSMPAVSEWVTARRRGFRVSARWTHRGLSASRITSTCPASMSLFRRSSSIPPTRPSSSRAASACPSLRH